jgi:hypothetical protein
MSTDLEAAVARLKRDLDAIAAETPGAREARGDVRLLLADWQRLREELADALDLRNGSGPTALSAVVVERDAARAEVERLCDWASKVIGDDGPDLDAYLDGHVATPNLARLSADEGCTSRDAAGYVLGSDRDTIWLCNKSKQSTYEWTQAVKHELGHVLGAIHMPCETQAVMGASQACVFKRSFDSVTYNIADYVTICNNGRTTGGICPGLFPLH